jgi:hypothetical protein
MPTVFGAVTGLVAWAAGYVLTYAVAAQEVRDAPLTQVVEALAGGPAAHEVVGWVFYNAHFVETVFRGLPVVGRGSANYVGGAGFTPFLYLVPAGLLFAAGVGLARSVGARGASDGFTAGATAVPGYLVLSLAGTFLFEVTVGGASGQPDPLAGVVLAGVVYPLLFAGGGGALAGAVSESAGRGDT